MWEKNLRLVSIFLIYQILFYNREESFFDETYWENDFIVFTQTLELEGVPSVNDAKEVIKNYFHSQKDLEETISKFSKEWSKTYSITRACLLAFILEKKTFNLGSFVPIEKVSITELDTDSLKADEDVEKNDPNTKLVKIYLKFTHDYIGEKNVALVHAILSKIIVE